MSTESTLLARWYRRLQRLATISLFALSSAVFAGSPPEFPAPDGSTVKRMGNQVNVNGLNLQIREFNSPDDMDRVRRFYRKHWPAAKDDPGFIESDAAQPWIVLSRFEEGYMMTVQMQPTDMGGTWGYLAIGLLPEPGEPNERPEPPKSPRGTIVLSANSSEDPGQRGQVFLLGNELSVKSNVAFFKNQYASWRSDLDQEMDQGNAHALSFTRGSKRVNMTIINAGKGSQITINLIEKSIL